MTSLTTNTDPNCALVTGRHSLWHLLCSASLTALVCATAWPLAASANEAGGAAKTQAQQPESSQVPFAISVDGQVVDESGRPAENAFGSQASASEADRTRKTDVDLNAVDIQIKYDGLEQSTLLNVSTLPMRASYRGGETVTFLPTANYPAFIARAELRITALRDGNQARHATIPVVVNTKASWVMPTEGDGDYSYVLRVYDARGRFDETAPLTLARTTADLAPDPQRLAVAPGMAEDRTAIQNIPVFGGGVTVYGRNVPPGYEIEAFQERIPVDAARSFVVQRILPSGDHSIRVALSGASKSGGLNFSRAINIPDNDWFYVALADLTVGRRIGDDDIETVRAGDYDNIYTKGRLAFYLKGKIKGKYLLTAAADINEDSLDDLFGGSNSKDPRQLLRRIDPDDYYPVYGDDSVIVEDAPTSGKFYVRLDRGDSHVMWGNYKTQIQGTEFMQSKRGLYGANAVYRSPAVTGFGEHRAEATAYAALAGTLPQRDEFLATGGSSYFLKRQDITVGSETVTVEIRDSVTETVISRRTLVEGQDYVFDYMQGLILLSRPLSTSVSRDTVRSDALGGDTVYLIAQYEYAPLLEEVDGYLHGGRVQVWLTDNLRVGVSELSDKSASANQQMVGMDFKLRPTLGSSVEGEFARSTGMGLGISRSTDGGITMSDENALGESRGANAWRVEGQLDLDDLNVPGISGKVSGFYDTKEAGFSGAGAQTALERQTWGIQGDVALSEDLRIKLGYSDLNEVEGKSKRSGDLATVWTVNPAWQASLGVTYTELFEPRAIAAGKAGHNGARFDTGFRLDYTMDDDRSFYGFSQGTVSQNGDIARNDRVGAGAEIRLTEKIGIAGEGSYGTSGLGAMASINYDPTADDHYYIGYRLDPDRTYGIGGQDLVGSDTGTIVSGARHKLNEWATAYAENNYDMFGRRQSLAQTYGVIYTPTDHWSINGRVQSGSIADTTIDASTGLERSDYDRLAGSLGLAYTDDDAGSSAHVRGEARLEDSEDGSRDLETYLFSAGMAWKTNPDWRILTSLDAVFSSEETASLLGGRYIETSMGYAYRPVDNDRLNALIKYTFLQDASGADQISSVSGRQNGPEQRSHIMSADANYDLYPWLTVGGKYGLRLGQMRDRGATAGDWRSSFAHLATVRADLHVLKRWDLLAEGRVLNSPSAGTTDYGFLTAVYRHVGDNFKVGVGYNFGIFSDDLRDLTLNDQGVFVNMVGKF